MQKIKTDLKTGAVKSAYLFCGPESYLIDYYTNEVIKTAVAEGTAEFNLLKISSRIPEEEEVEGFISSYPFMSDKKVLCIKNSGLLKRSNDAQKKFWTELLEAVPDYAIVIFAEAETDKRSGIYKLFSKKHTVCEFAYQKPSELSSWVIKIFKSVNISIEPRDASRLVELCGPAMQNIRSETDKLSAYALNSGKVTSDDIELVVSKNVENRVFAMIDDIADGKNGEAYEKLRDLKTLNEEPIKIISIIFGKFSSYKKLFLLRNKSTREICSITGMYERHAANAVRQLKRLGIERVERILEKCMEMDFKVKSGKIDKWLAVELIISEAANREARS